MKLWKVVWIFAVSIALIMLVGCGKAEEEPAEETETTPAVEEAKVVADYTPTEEDIGLEVACAVCGMEMTVTAEMPAVTYDGETYYFCNAEEKAAFAANPEEYLTTEEAPAETEGESTPDEP